MDELEIGGNKFISSKRASELTGYAKDYVGQLAREGRVTATLVGRGWYILESAIHEHRFGNSSVVSSTESEIGVSKQPEDAVPNPWGTSRYSSEEVPSIFPVHTPVVSPGVDLFAAEQQEVVEPVAAPEPSPEPMPILSDMQSAWQDWFKNRESIVLEQAPQEEDAPETAPEPLEEAMPVMLHITREVPEELVESVPEPVEAMQQGTEPEPVVIYEAPVRAKSSYVSQAILLTVAGIAVLVAVVGTGSADFIANRGGVQASVINFLGGASLLDRTSK